ncbi:hypothetical protein QE152_g13159 [Popillia japonica]|uniref:Retrotransposon Copia-like N-terminal domain-containing protein n=1 Tax=Popillia japonica TaxID=7064 RepID=A0AAW1LDH5_POPJA
MDAAQCLVTVNRLNNNNWNVWKFQINVILMAKGLYDITTGNEKEPAEVDLKASWKLKKSPYEVWNNKSFSLRSLKGIFGNDEAFQQPNTIAEKTDDRLRPRQTLKPPTRFDDFATSYFSVDEDEPTTMAGDYAMKK